MADFPVVILAAGLGLRLRPLTEAVPKCLLEVGCKTILDHQLDSYEAAGVDEIYVAVGYRASMIREHCQRRDDSQVKLIENRDYRETNNMYSLQLATEFLSGRRFLLSNGDCVYDPEIIEQALSHPDDDFIVCQRAKYDVEAMKVTVDASSRVSNIAKDITQPNAFGNSIDIHRFSPANSKQFFDYIEDVIFEQDRRNEWFEAGLRELVRQGDFVMRPLDVKTGRFAEIDTLKDLKIAKQLFGG